MEGQIQLIVLYVNQGITAATLDHHIAVVALMPRIPILLAANHAYLVPVVLLLKQYF